jgi:hypothetical protein
MNVPIFPRIQRFFNNLKTRSLPIRAGLSNLRAENALTLDSADWLALVLITAVSFAARMYLLRGSSSPGSDGFIYLVQVRSIIEEHRMHYADISIIYPYFCLIAIITKNYFLSITIGISLLTSFFCAAAFIFVRHHGRAFAVLISLWAALSPAVFFMASQFPKNFLALVFFVCMLYALRSGRVLLFLLWIAASLVTHRMTAALSIFLIVILIVTLKRFRAYLAAGLVIPALLFAILSLFPGTLHFADAARFSGIMSMTPQFAPYSFVRMMGGGSLHPVFIAECALCAGVVIYVLVRAGFYALTKETSSRLSLSLALVAAVMYFPFFVLDAQGPAYRLYIASLPLSLLLFADAVQPAAKTFIAILFPVILLPLIFYTAAERPGKYDPPYAFYEKLSVKLQSMLDRDPVDLIVAHRPLAETIDYYLRRDTLAWKPEDRFETKKVWRVVKGVERWEIENLIGRNTQEHIRELSANYLLVREDLWDSFSSLVSQADNPDLYCRIYSEDNPYRVRPAYITRSK